MEFEFGGSLQETLNNLIGPTRTSRLFRILVVDPALTEDSGSRVSRAKIAQALNMLLFEDLIERVPAAKVYVEHCLAHGRKVMHDHGAVRTIAMTGMGNLPAGEESITRILRPLGYSLNGVYPLERLRMTGRSYAHADAPDEIAQFFVSELHPGRFSPAFQDAVSRVLAGSQDPLSPKAQFLLHELARDGRIGFADAAAMLPELKACFARQHAVPHLADYEILLAESAEMAWIATEGNMFNHVTDRVDDLLRVTEEQKALQRPMKQTIEVSGSGRIKQTAFKADMVLRQFVGVDGELIEMMVPGSFYEFISRDHYLDAVADVTKLDLGFDAANAQGIFKMTATA